MTSINLPHPLPLDTSQITSTGAPMNAIYNVGTVETFGYIQQIADTSTYGYQDIEYRNISKEYKASTFKEIIKSLHIVYKSSGPDLKQRPVFRFKTHSKEVPWSECDNITVLIDTIRRCMCISYDSGYKGYTIGSIDILPIIMRYDISNSSSIGTSSITTIK